MPNNHENVSPLVETKQTWQDAWNMIVEQNLKKHEADLYLHLEAIVQTELQATTNETVYHYYGNFAPILKRVNEIRLKFSKSSLCEVLSSWIMDALFQTKPTAADVALRQRLACKLKVNLGAELIHIYEDDEDGAYIVLRVHKNVDWRVIGQKDKLF